MKLSRDKVIDCWNFFERRYGTRHVNKRTWLMSLMAKKMGIRQLDDFFNSYSNILGDVIYIPFRLGSWDRSYHSQLVICAHEHQHKIQADRMGWLKFAWKYATDTVFRTNMEIEGYTVGMEVYHLLTRQIPDVPDVNWSDYMVKDRDAVFARTNFRIIREMIKRGGITRQASKDFREWMQTYED